MNGIVNEDCPYYSQGFCILGPWCKYNHIRKELCINFAHGYCQDGANCKFAHPRPLTNEEEQNFGLIKTNHYYNVYTEVADKLSGNVFNKQESIREAINLGKIVCYACGVEGHKSNNCPDKRQR